MKDSLTLDKQNVEDILGLTPVQEGMLFHYLNEPGSGLYFEQMSFTLSGQVDVSAVKNAWDFVICANGMLRTVFRWEGIEKPVQVILKKYAAPIREYDFSSLESENEREKTLDEIRKKDRKESIDIRREPFRILLIKLHDNRYEMIVSSYHIVFDGWSNGIILKEFVNAYHSFYSGGTPDLRVKTSYKEYLKWLSHQNKEAQGKYWSEHLQYFDTKTLLPVDRKNSTSAVEAKDLTKTLSKEHSEKIAWFARYHKVTIATLLYSAWGLLLQKYNDAESVLFGTTVSGRTPEIRDVEQIVGLFISTPPLKISFQPEEKVNELIKRVDSLLSGRTEFEGTPLTEIRKYCDIGINGNMFDSIVVIENYPLDKFIKEKESVLQVSLSSIFEMTNYALTLVISTEENIGLRFIYDPASFEKDTVQRLMEHYSNILMEMVNKPDATISHIEMLSEEEKRHILFDLNNNLMEYPKDATVCSLFEKQVQKTPDHTAVVFGNESMSYRQLNQRANKLAKLLSKKGVGPEVVVGIMLDRSIDMVVSLMAILKAGGAYLPIDINLPVDRVLYMLQNSGAKFLITKQSDVGEIPFTQLRGFETCEGIQIQVTAKREHIKDFESLPVPDRSLIDITKYKGKIGMASVNNCISLQTTRGCPYKCLYCHKIWSKNHVRRSAENIFNEIEYYYRNGVTNFAVIDDCFNLDMENSGRLFKLIIKNGLKLQLFFPNGLRGDIMTPEYIDLMVEAGTRGINLSLETASPRLQKMLMKNLDIDKFRIVVEYIAKKHPEIILEMATMHGFPTETEEEAMMTLDFIKCIKWLHFPYIHILKIFPNTEMEEFALMHGVAKEDIWKSRNRAFHELPETLPFPKGFTRKYQASFMNEYFLNKERLKHVLPTQLKILDEAALAQKYNAYLPVEINSIEDVIRFAEINDFIIPKKELTDTFVVSIFDREQIRRKTPEGAKKVLLLDISQHFSSHNMLYKVSEQPIGHIYLLTYLKRKFGDRIDGRICKSGVDFDSFEELKVLVEEYQPDMIGIRTLTYFREFFHETVSLVRQWGVTVPIVCGGPYASSDYDTILKDKNVDLVLFGEGEYTLAELVDAMLENEFKLPKNNKLESIKGIAYPLRDIENKPDSSREILYLDRLHELIELEDGSNLEVAVKGDNLAYVMYTSGSTGNPKGVMVEHRQINNCSFWMQKEFSLKDNDMIVQRTNLTFDPSVWEIFWPLQVGAGVFLITAEQGRDAGFLLKLMEQNRDITMMYCPASLVTGMTYLLNEKEEMLSLKMPWLIIGAESINADTVRNFYRYFEGRIVNTYGPTECTINNTYAYLDRDTLGNVVPIGRPVANNNIYILSKDKQVVPLKAAGEIYIAGDSVARGYINNNEKTELSFIKPMFNEERMYRSGDAGRWLEDGNIEFLGRVDEQIKMRGYKIEPGEIESVLSSCSGIKDCVITIKDGKKRKAETKVCKICGIPSAYPNVGIGEDNVCGVCRDFEMYKSYADMYFKKVEDLDTLIREKNRDKQGKYDCLLLYSGGRGSAYALYTLVDKGYKVLAATYDNGYFTKSDMDNIKTILNKLGVDHVILTHKNTDKILKESLKLAQTVCRGCFHISSSLAHEYAYKNNIYVVVGATLSRGQILENKLSLFYSQGISEVAYIEKELKGIQKSGRQMDKAIFDYIDIDVINDGTAYDAVTSLDFYRYCDVTNEEMINSLSQRDPYWETRKKFAVYSTNCPIKQIGDYCHLAEKGYHYYGSATSWEKRLNHISFENLKQDLTCYVSKQAFDNFARRIGYKKENGADKIETNYICAYYTSDEEIDASKIKEHLLNKLPSYMIPSYFIQINEIPLTPNGKVDKKALPEPDKLTVMSIEYAAPENETEEALTEIWRKILNVDRIGRNDNFFDIGGNSILLIQMHAKVEKIFPGKITMTDLFAYTTIAKLAEHILSSGDSTSQEILALPLSLPLEYLGSDMDSAGSAAFKLKIDGTLYKKVRKITVHEGINIEEFIISMWMYSIAQISENKRISIQNLLNGKNAVSITVDMGNIYDFSTLFKKVSSERNNKKGAEAYGIKYIERERSNWDRTSVLPLIYDRKALEDRVNLIELFDIVIEMNDEGDAVSLGFEYNGKKLRNERMRHLINSFAGLTGVLAEKYEIQEGAKV